MRRERPSSRCSVQPGPVSATAVPPPWTGLLLLHLLREISWEGRGPADAEIRAGILALPCTNMQESAEKNQRHLLLSPPVSVWCTGRGRGNENRDSSKTLSSYLAASCFTGCWLAGYWLLASCLKTTKGCSCRAYCPQVASRRWS